MPDEITPSPAAMLMGGVPPPELIKAMFRNAVTPAMQALSDEDFEELRTFIEGEFANEAHRRGVVAATANDVEPDGNDVNAQMAAERAAQMLRDAEQAARDRPPDPPAAA